MLMPFETPVTSAYCPSCKVHGVCVEMDLGCLLFMTADLQNALPGKDADGRPVCRRDICHTRLS